MDILDCVIENTIAYINDISKEQRKSYGQFFTSKESAKFMASLFTIPQNKSSISILDPGAGSGILAIALLVRLDKINQIQNVRLVCYENDRQVLPLLKKNLDNVCSNLSMNIEVSIREENYILSQETEYKENKSKDAFDLIIGNPPYLKIRKDKEEALVMSDICYGAPNLYFLFLGMSLFNLVDNGELVYIIPRSWTSGAYFAAFRKKLFSLARIEHIHLFIQRDKIFDNENVLQETMIIKFKKTVIPSPYIKITTTKNNSDFSSISQFNANYNDVVKGKDKYVYLITNEKEIETLRTINKFTNTLPILGMKMKTGLTVDYRHKELLRTKPDNESIPLFYPNHIKNGFVDFPIQKDNQYIKTSQKGLVQKNDNYLFVKRFTSKEESRRLQCGVYIGRKHPGYSKISTQNKINFITGENGLSECTVYGLYVLFNSSFYDSYYRILNGSTQVNATEINNIPLPSLDDIQAMGRKLITHKDMSDYHCDAILKEYLYV